VVQRKFLREFMTRLDLVEEHDDCDAGVEYGFEPSSLSPEEQHALTGEPSLIAADAEGDELVGVEEVW